MSSLVLIAGMALTAGNFYPLNMYMHLTGIIGWLVVALAWHDRSLIMLKWGCRFYFYKRNYRQPILNIPKS